jgi:hypothetical protein
MYCCSNSEVSWLSPGAARSSGISCESLLRFWGDMTDIVAAGVVDSGVGSSIGFMVAAPAAVSQGGSRWCYKSRVLDLRVV